MTDQRSDKVEYATVADTTGCDYREIADTLTMLGYTMNHSSARNYVMRGVEKIVVKVLEANGVTPDSDNVRRIARSARFQSGLAEILRMIEDESAGDVGRIDGEGGVN